MIVLMHQSKCEATKSFQPWLHAVANLVPGIQIGQIDIGAARSIATVFKGNDPAAIKPSSRQPKGQADRGLQRAARIRCAAGLVQGSRRAVASLSAYGAEREPSASAAGGKASGMSRLLEVRHGGDDGSGDATAAHPDGARRWPRGHYILVQERFAKIVGDEETDMEDKFAVQEANRRARNEVQEELLKDAPANIRAEVRAAVNLGDMGKGNTASSGGWTGTLNKESAKKDEL